MYLYVNYLRLFYSLLHPEGVGIGMLLCSGIVCIYYNVIIAWTLYYLFSSFRAILPWSYCGNSWNDELCIDENYNATAAALAAYFNSSAGGNDTGYALEGNMTLESLNLTANTSHLQTASEQFWE